MRDGILIIDKPEGISSAKTVWQVKKALHLDKVGHTGTLDPFATGLLILCLNQATKKANIFFNLDKTYTGKMILGISTDTQDLTGRVIRICSKGEKRITYQDIEKVFQQFQGELWQIPPIYSALKVTGKPLYQLARKGIKVLPAPRKIKILQLNLLAIRWDQYPSITFKVKCSKGTYIRTLCNDIGDYLGFGAYLSELRRIKVGNISIKKAIPLSVFTKLPYQQQEKYILPFNAVLENIVSKES